MFFLSVQPQVTVPLSHLINALHSLKHSLCSSSNAAVKTTVKKEHDREPQLQEHLSTLRELGLSDLGVQHLDELVGRLLPGLKPPETCRRRADVTCWRTSHCSSYSFYENKNGYSQNHVTTPFLSRQNLSPLQMVCKDLQQLSVSVQRRGFKTLRNKTGRPQETLSFMKTPSLQGFLNRGEMFNMDRFESLTKLKNKEYGQQDSYKRGFTDGYLKAQVLKQHSKNSLWIRNMLFYALIITGLVVIPLVFVRFQNTARHSAVDPVKMKSVTFDHVKGADEAKNELQEVVEFLKKPKKFTVLGGKLPKGVLLAGPPGTGKTLLAKAVAGEADVPFYYASGSDFDELWVGLGARRIRNLFTEAKANAPCVIFIDELDSVGGKRIDSPSHPYSRQTINQLLAELDGFKVNEGVIVIGATNIPESLDTALVRPGRFDMQVTVPMPDVKGRTEILELYLSKVKADSDIVAKTIARGTVGFSGADLENLVNQAALKAAVDGKSIVSMKEMEFAKDKILMGPEKKSAEIDEKSLQITAYRESGHAIVAFYTKDALPIHKATIMPRGSLLGNVLMLSENDLWGWTRSQLLAVMDIKMGGRVAEEMMFGRDNITTDDPEARKQMCYLWVKVKYLPGFQKYICTGASSDFDKATRIAEQMVTNFGMCKKLGVMTSKDMTQLSPETQAVVENEVRVLLKDSYERAKALLLSHAVEHKNLADALLKYETLNGKEVQMIMEGKTLDSR